MRGELEVDRVRAIITKIAELEDRIPYPSNLALPHPIQLLKEAEQQVSRKQCVICGRNDVILEQHHVAGRARYTDTITLCETCHDELSNIYQPKWIHTVKHPLRCYLLGWSDVFHLIWAKTKHPYFYELSKVLALNASYPQ